LYDHQHRLSGIIFTNSVSPEQKVLDLIKRTNIPLLQVDEDSFSVATRINKMIFKVYDKESHKIKAAQDLVEQYVNLDAVCAIL
jgi:BioD-like phosphotransacetylase family protein